MRNKATLPPEWSRQQAVLLALPHPGTDWAPILAETLECYRNIILAAKDHAHILLIAPDEGFALKALGLAKCPDWLTIHAFTTNDTWTRDYGPLSVYDASLGKWILRDFTFNGWGMKFPACFDNTACRSLDAARIFGEDALYSNDLDFVLEGGSIETDGDQSILTTAECLLSPNRNPGLDRAGIERRIKDAFGCSRVLWLENGSLAGDDTDSHIDTLARFISPHTIAYTACENTADINYTPLKLMEEELRALRTSDGEPYRLIPLFIPDPIFNDGEQLPATYANFLILNDAVLLPVYGDKCHDDAAIEAIRAAMPSHTIMPIDCRPLIKQHGSLHCATMQLPYLRGKL